MLKTILIINVLIFTGCVSSKSHHVATAKYLNNFSNTSLKDQYEHFTHHGITYYIIEKEDRKNLKKRYPRCIKATSGELIPSTGYNRQFVYNGKVYGISEYSVVDDGSCGTRKR